jgi:hypothetical protein
MPFKSIEDPLGLGLGPLVPRGINEVLRDEGHLGVLRAKAAEGGCLEGLWP